MEYKYIKGIPIPWKWESREVRIGKIKLSLLYALYDWWVGGFFQRGERKLWTVYVLPIPFFGLRIRRIRTLEIETDYFKANEATWALKHDDRFALVKGHEVNFYRSHDEAYACGLKMYGAVAMLIRQVGGPREMRHAFKSGRG